jgi:hypothetical protein
MDYLASLSPKQLLAIDIAKRNLGPSFHLEKSNGYLKFMAATTKSTPKK